MEDYIELDSLGKGSNGTVSLVKDLENNEVWLFLNKVICNENIIFKS